MVQGTETGNGTPKKKLPRKEIIRGSTKIELLFSSGKQFFYFPYKIFYIYQPRELPFEVLFSVSKRNFKSAVDRNLVKRRIRESFRLNKNELLKSLLHEDETFLVGIVYVGKEIFDFETIDTKLKAAFSKLGKGKGLI
ncbi:MAG: ribonuclease P protein component [Cytophagales bacterium]|nr:ribonuclease P protein component [Cytophagales bacterium]